MPKKNISTLPPRAIALTVLSKLLYALADESGASEEVKVYHKKMLVDIIAEYDLYGRSDEDNSFSITDIPWLQILDQIANHPILLKGISASHDFTQQEVRYLAAMACGLTGKEYGLITGFKSHYNLSWSIRQKLGLPEKTSNLRLLLHGGNFRLRHESLGSVAPK